MQGSEKELEKFILKLDNERSWLLKNIDKGKWPKLERNLHLWKEKLVNLF